MTTATVIHVYAVARGVEGGWVITRQGGTVSEDQVAPGEIERLVKAGAVEVVSTKKAAS